MSSVLSPFEKVNFKALMNWVLEDAGKAVYTTLTELRCGMTEASSMNSVVSVFELTDCVKKLVAQEGLTSYAAF